MADNSKELRDRRRADGLCPLCGKKPTNGVRCEQCKSKRKQQQKHQPWFIRTWQPGGWSYEYRKQHDKHRNHSLRLAVIAHYSDGENKCACCGEAELLFLTIDHVNNDGNIHRRSIKRVGSGFYRWLIDHGFPSGFQVLCYNCNIGKAQNGGICPHKKFAEGEA